MLVLDCSLPKRSGKASARYSGVRLASAAAASTPKVSLSWATVTWSIRAHTVSAGVSPAGSSPRAHEGHLLGVQAERSTKADRPPPPG